MRDVAQMVRSIDYVALTTSRGRGTEATEWAVQWSRDVAAAFVVSYLDAMEVSTLLPDTDDAFDALINAFVVARSLRELHWELATRPEMAAVPLTAILRLLRRDPDVTA